MLAFHSLPSFARTKGGISFSPLLPLRHYSKEKKRKGGRRRKRESSRVDSVGGWVVASSFSSLFVSSPPSSFFLHLGEQHAAAAASPSSLIFHPKKEIVLFLFRGSAYFSPKKGRERQKRRAKGGGGWLLPLSLSASILAQLASQPLSLLFLLLCSPSPLLSFSSRSLINLIFRSFFSGKFLYYRTTAVRPCPGGPFVIIAQEADFFIREEKRNVSLSREGT